MARRTHEALLEAQNTIRVYADELEERVAKRTAELELTVGELEAFSYSIAHDMRAPLRSMAGFAHLLQQEHAFGLDTQGREYLDRIARSALRMDQLICDVLDYSRIVREEFPLEPVALGSLVHELLEIYPNLAAAKGRITVAPDLPTVRANTAAMTQVLSNLLGNAVKFVAPGCDPDVHVHAMLQPREGGQRWVRLCIDDAGIGIDPAVQPRLFKMFQRFTLPGSYEGTGIGLAIARKAMERVKGRIGMEPRSPKGTRFWVELPMVELSASS